MNAADGSNQTRLTYNDAQDTGSSWSPDGTKIAFASNKEGNSEIYLMDAVNGSGQIRLTNNTATEGEPDW
jgi:Tol biopolymer transport system component